MKKNFITNRFVVIGRNCLPEILSCFQRFFYGKVVGSNGKRRNWGFGVVLDQFVRKGEQFRGFVQFVIANNTNDQGVIMERILLQEPNNWSHNTMKTRLHINPFKSTSRKAKI
jgi:hypothetical protein